MRDKLKKTYTLKLCFAGVGGYNNCIVFAKHFINNCSVVAKHFINNCSVVAKHFIFIYSVAGFSVIPYLYDSHLSQMTL